MRGRAKLARFLLAPLGAALLAMLGCGGSGGTRSSSESEWTWESGSTSLNQPGFSGTEGVPAEINVPGARVSPLTWTDSSGNLWLFGGTGFDSPSTNGWLNDLWRYSGGQWTWMGGSNSLNQPGIYGTEGAPDPANIPGSRFNAVGWTDSSGNFWLFGGSGIDSTGKGGTLNDLWRYSNGQWTWMSGSDTVADYPNCRPGVYGTQGVPAPANVPGARFDAVSWTDPSANLWLFGGEGYDSEGFVGSICSGTGLLNDLWRYSNGEWTWVGGSNTRNQNGIYGTLGGAAPGNVPGARAEAVAWADSSGNLWLFGGEGNDSGANRCQHSGGPCFLNDLWKYSAGEWTWMGGSNVMQQPGTYGTRGTPAPGNIPGARESAVGWVDQSGNLWLFGGNGFGSTGTYGDLNDLWEYDPGTKMWTWMSGSNTVDQTGVYGTEGTPGRANVPGARDSAAGWVDQGGNLWLFGGGDYLSVPYGGKFNDLWKYQP